MKTLSFGSSVGVLRGWLVGMALAVLWSMPAPAQHATPDGLPPASENQGRTGVYRASTSHDGYNYFVGVAEEFTPESPAGIHVFFHGMGAQAMARNFQLWKPYYTEARCIGIHMEYTDGNPHRDMTGKAAAAMEAVKQVMADYPVVVGRGAMTAFSAGGSPAGVWFKNHARKSAQPTIDWPFSHVNVFGSSLNAGEELTARPTSWFRAMGSGEERMAPGLMRYMTSRTAANLTDPRKGACPDAIFLVTKGRGHTILPDEVAMSAECFARSATMQAPFLYRPADVSREVGVAIDAANAHQFARALKSRAISNKLRGLIEQQMVKQIALVGKLAKTDPGLARVYGEICAEQFRGTEAAKRIKAVMPDARFKEIRRLWHEKFDQIFTGKGIKLGPGAPEFLRAIAKESGEQSTLARMAKLYLAFEEDASSDQPRRRRR